MSKINAFIFLAPPVFLISILWPGSGNSQDLSIDTLREMSLSELMEVEVVTPSKSARRLSAAPANVIVVTRQQIRERGYVNLADLMEELPGVDVNRNTTGVYTQISVRGHGGNNNFIIMQDGIRTSSPTGELIPVQDNFPLFHAKRVEVVFGPGSALYGADAFAGVVNIITQDAEKIDGVEVSSAVGTDDYYYDYLNFGKKLTEKTSLTFGGHWHDSQNPDLSKTYEGAFQKKDLVSNGRVIVKAENREPFAAPTNSYSAYMKLDYDKKFTGGMTRSFFSHPTTTGFKPEQTRFGKDAVLETSIETYNGRYKHDFGGSLRGESMVDYSIYTLLPDTKFTNIGPDFAAFKYAKGDKLKLEQQLNYQIDRDHGAIGGFVFENFDSIPRTPDLPQKYDTGRDPDRQNFFFPNTDNSLPIKIYDLNYQNYAGYVQAESAWAPMVSTVVGVRYDYNTRYGDAVNPRAALIVTPAESTTLKLLYGESFRAPPAEFAYRFFGSFTGAKNASGEYISNFFNLPNPDLKPEKLRTVETNIVHNVTRNFIVQASGFYTRVSDAQTSVVKNEISHFIEGAEIRGFSRFENSGERTIFGGDLRADYQLALHKTNIKFWGSYSWVDGREDLPGGGEGPLGLTARNHVKGGATVRYAEKYFITPKFSWIDRTSLFSSVSTGKVPSYALVNLHAGVDDFYKGLSFFIDVRNLLDENYFNAAALRQSFIFSPQDPRKIYAGLSYKF